MWQKSEGQTPIGPKIIKTTTQEAKKVKSEIKKGSLLTVQWVLSAIILVACLLAAQLVPGFGEWFKTEYAAFVEQGISMSCDDKVIRFASQGFDDLKDSLQVFAANLEGKKLAMGGEYEITHATYLKTVTTSAYRLSDQPYMPVTGTVTSEFGYRIHPITGNQDFHTGIDIAAPKGTDIKSAFYGIVAEIGKDDINGNYIKVVHSQNVCTAYCHLDSVETKVGEQVKRGDVLGTVGETGMATGPHLHFEILIDGVRVNPADALRI